MPRREDLNTRIGGDLAISDGANLDTAGVRAPFEDPCGRGVVSAPEEEEPEHVSCVRLRLERVCRVRRHRRSR